MNSSCPIDAFDLGPSQIPCEIQKSSSYFQTTVIRIYLAQQLLQNDLLEVY